MNDNKIRETIDAALSEEFELSPDQLVPTAHIKEDLGLDSLDIVDMVILLQEQQLAAQQLQIAKQRVPGKNSDTWGHLCIHRGLAR